MNNIFLELTPIEAERLTKFINKHPNETITISEKLGVGYGYTLMVCSEESHKQKEITDFDAF